MDARTLNVTLSGGGPWGFRLHGGRGTGQPLTISKTRRKSKAYQVLLEGDVLLSLNGQSCSNLSHDQAMAIVDSGCPELRIEILRGTDHNKENEPQKEVPLSKPEAPSVAATTWTPPTGNRPPTTNGFGGSVVLNSLNAQSTAPVAPFQGEASLAPRDRKSVV